MQTEQGLQRETRISKPVVSKRLYTVAETAIYLGRPVSSVRGLLWKGLLPYIQTGRVQYIDLKDIDSYIEQNKTRMV
jgi:excisionase family DNA binding protein